MSTGRARCVNVFDNIRYLTTSYCTTLMTGSCWHNVLHLGLFLLYLSIDQFCICVFDTDDTIGFTRADWSPRSQIRV